MALVWLAGTSMRTTEKRRRGLLSTGAVSVSCFVLVARPGAGDDLRPGPISDAGPKAVSPVTRLQRAIIARDCAQYRAIIALLSGWFLLA